MRTRLRIRTLVPAHCILFTWPACLTLGTRSHRSFASESIAHGGVDHAYTFVVAEGFYDWCCWCTINKSTATTEHTVVGVEVSGLQPIPQRVCECGSSVDTQARHVVAVRFPVRECEGEHKMPPKMYIFFFFLVSPAVQCSQTESSLPRRRAAEKESGGPCCGRNIFRQVSPNQTFDIGFPDFT